MIGIGFTLYLQTFIQDEVFFSGDGGLKALQVRQFCRGDLGVGLNLEADPWVHRLWDQGFYPFEPPFVYRRLDRREVAFHFLFPALSAPFYKLFGHRGLYLIPLCATWLTWIAFLRLCRIVGLGDRWGALATTVLIASSPLTLHSAMFWEHTLAVLLGTFGLAALLRSVSEAGGWSGPVRAGVFLGLAAWIRPEFYVFAIAAGVFTSAFYFSQMDLRWRVLLAVSLMLTIAVFWAINLLVYRHPLGAHSLQVFEEFSASKRWQAYKFDVTDHTKGIFSHMRAVLFYVVSIPVCCRLTRERVPRRQAVLLYVLAITLLASVPLILLGIGGGKQWGPRFLLMLTPIVSLQVVWALKQLGRRGKAWLLVSLVGFLYCIGSDVWVNTCLGAKVLRYDYRRRILPALRYLREADCDVVIVPHQYIAMELEAAFTDKIFFEIDRWEEMDRLIPEIWAHGHRRVICMLYADDRWPRRQDVSFGETHLRIVYRSLGALGEYRAVEGHIRERRSSGKQVSPPNRAGP